MTLEAPYFPDEVTDVFLAFPADVSDLMPAYEDIPEEFRDMNAKNKWVDFQEEWFYKGLKEDVKFYPKQGIDPEAAFRHLKAIQGSFQPKHEHKRAAVAYLASLWFESIKYG